jgi:hypothetical protein
MSVNGTRWMDVVDEWELGGRQGDVPPGMGEPEPERDASKRDYFTPYPNAWLLRPEVINIYFYLSSNRSFFADLFFFFHRLSNVFLLCGGLREMSSGENVVTGFSKLSRNIHVRNMVIRAFVVSMGRMFKNLMKCRGISFLFFLFFPLYVMGLILFFFFLFIVGF